MKDSIIVKYDPSIITKEEIKKCWKSQARILLELLASFEMLYSVSIFVGCSGETDFYIMQKHR
jgi:hypothetical protein